MEENVFAKNLVRILLLVFYPSESSDIRRYVGLVCLVWFVPSQDDAVLWSDVRVCLVCPAAVAGNSVHLNKILPLAKGGLSSIDMKKVKKSCCFSFSLVRTMGMKEISGSEGKQSCRASPEGRAPLEFE